MTAGQRPAPSVLRVVRRARPGAPTHHVAFPRAARPYPPRRHSQHRVSEKFRRRPARRGRAGRARSPASTSTCWPCRRSTPVSRARTASTRPPRWPARSAPTGGWPRPSPARRTRSAAGTPVDARPARPDDAVDRAGSTASRWSAAVPVRQWHVLGLGSGRARLPLQAPDPRTGRLRRWWFPDEPRVAVAAEVDGATVVVDAPVVRAAHVGPAAAPAAPLGRRAARSRRRGRRPQPAGRAARRAAARPRPRARRRPFPRRRRGCSSTTSRSLGDAARRDGRPSACPWATTSPSSPPSSVTPALQCS